jgi:hypothetical protein
VRGGGGGGASAPAKPAPSEELARKAALPRWRTVACIIPWESRTPVVALPGH